MSYGGLHVYAIGRTMKQRKLTLRRLYCYCFIATIILRFNICSPVLLTLDDQSTMLRAANVSPRLMPADQAKLGCSMRLRILCRDLLTWQWGTNSLPCNDRFFVVTARLGGIQVMLIALMVSKIHVVLLHASSDQGSF